MTDRKIWKTGLSFGIVTEEKLYRAAAAGLDLVETNGVEDPSDWAKIPQWEKNTGVKVWSLHLPFKKVPKPDAPCDDSWKEMAKVHQGLIEGCGVAGIRHMVIHPSGEPIPDIDRARHMQIALPRLSALSDVCKKNGTVLCIEDLPRTCLGRDSEEMLRIMEYNPDFRICFDVNHLLRGSHEDFVEKVGKYIVTTHISDYDFRDECHLIPMRGQINWRALQTALELADYKGPFLYEGLGIGHTWEDVRPNHEYLKNL